MELDDYLVVHGLARIQFRRRSASRDSSRNVRGHHRALWRRAFQRQAATSTLLEISRLAQATHKLDRLIVFGSYVTSKHAPRDVDIILVMRDDFDMRACDPSTKPLFEHQQAEHRFGASVFWIRPAMLVAESLESFVAHWQVKRDGTRRGIVEVLL